MKFLKGKKGGKTSNGRISLINKPVIKIEKRKKRRGRRSRLQSRRNILGGIHLSISFSVGRGGGVGEISRPKRCSNWEKVLPKPFKEFCKSLSSELVVPGGRFYLRKRDGGGGDSNQLCDRNGRGILKMEL